MKELITYRYTFFEIKLQRSIISKRDAFAYRYTFFEIKLQPR